MMKRTLCIWLAVFMMLIFVGCTKDDLTDSGDYKDDSTLSESSHPTDEPFAYQLYVGANEKLVQADSLAADFSMCVMMLSDGETETVADTYGRLKWVINSETDIDMELLTTLSLMGMDIDVTAYYIDGYLYSETMGIKQKLAMGIEEAMRQSGAYYTINFQEDAIKEASVQKTATGYNITFVLDAAVIGDIMKDQISDTTGSGGADFTLEDMMLSVTLTKDRNLKFMHYSFSYSTETGAQKTDGTAEMEMNFTQIGGVTIDFPNDLDSYDSYADGF